MMAVIRFRMEFVVFFRPVSARGEDCYISVKIWIKDLQKRADIRSEALLGRYFKHQSGSLDTDHATPLTLRAQ
jgi:hypothetical protein